MLSFRLLLPLLISLSAVAQGAAGYYHLEVKAGVFQLRPLGMDAACSQGTAVSLCQPVNLNLPERCNFECKNALLSGQGTAVVKGAFSEGGRDFVVESGFDTWRSHALPSTLFQITSSDASCESDFCRGNFLVKNLKTGRTSALREILFTRADDVNYKLDAARALGALHSVDGLLVTGSIKKQALAVRYVFRVWISEATCNPLSKVKTLILPQDETETLFLLIGDESEATAPSDGRTLYWAQQLESDIQSTIFKTGINDLWAQVVRIDRSTCAVEILQEH